jgi:hypothetical protein
MTIAGGGFAFLGGLCANTVEVLKQVRLMLCDLYSLIEGRARSCAQ